MRRKSFYLGMTLMLALAGAVTTVLVLMVRHVPGTYERSALPPGEERQLLSARFKASFAQLINGIVNNREWGATFKEEEINGYFQEDFVQERGAEKLLPEGISDPRVVILPDTMRLSFHYGKEPWAAIVTIDFRMWRPPEEPYTLALELQGMRAGALPISSHSLLERISQAAQQQNMEIAWYRRNGNPVALMRFQTDRTYPTIQFDRVHLDRGTFLLTGLSTEVNPRARPANEEEEGN